MAFLKMPKISAQFQKLATLKQGFARFEITTIFNGKKSNKMKNKIDLTKTSEWDLSLHVFNIEELYKIRHFPDKLKIEIDNRFLYDEKQWNDLQNDLDKDRDELEQWTKKQDIDDLPF